MAALSVQVPYPVFYDREGQPIDNGNIYIGVANLDPVTNPIAVYYDEALTIPASQPLKTSNGYIYRNGTPAQLYVNAANFSITVKDSQNLFVYNFPDGTGIPQADASAITFTGFKGQVGHVDDLATADGSDWIGFQPADVTSIARSIEDKLRDVVSVKDFGAVGDGVADDTDAIKDAIAAAVASTPAKLVFPAGTYKCTGSLGIYFASDLIIDGQGATLDFSTVSVGANIKLLAFEGTSEAALTLTSNAAAAQKTVAVNSATLAAGDFVKIYSDSVWDSLRTSSKYGELNFIKDIPTGSSVTLTNDLASNYNTAASAKIEKLNPVRNIVVNGLKFVGPSGDDIIKALVFKNGINCIVNGISSFDIDNVHVQLFDCTFSGVFNSFFQESNAASTAYGTSFADATQDCIAMGNTYTDVRHSLSTNNTSGGYGITRRILFSGNVVTDSALATGGSGGDAIDTHAGAEDIFIICNVVNSSSLSGINVECRSAIIQGNSVSYCQGNGITHQNYTDLAGTSIIANNNVKQVFGNYGIVVVPNSADFTSSVIDGNIVDVTEISGIRARPGSGGFQNIAVTGNSVKSIGDGVNAGIDVKFATTGTISGNAVRAPSIGIQGIDLTNIAITGNSVRLLSNSGTANGYGVRLTDASYGCVVTGNTLYDASNLTASNAVLFENTVTYSGIFANVGSQFTGATKFDVGTGTGNSAANNITGV